MIKKILLVGLWTAVLTFATLFIAVLLCVMYSRVMYHGAAPKGHARQTLETIWTYTPQITAPIALLAGVFGFLPGTKVRETCPGSSEWARWCYRLSVAVALFAMLASLRWDSAIWNVLGTTPIGFALVVALIDKYAQKGREADH